MVRALKSSLYAAAAGKGAETRPQNDARRGGLEHQKSRSRRLTRYFKSGASLLNGAGNHGNWYYAVGTQRAWHGGIAGAAHAESQVELYVLISQQHLA